MTPIEPTMPEPELSQERRAMQTILAVMAGGDPTTEAMVLSNDFTDRQSAKIARWFRRTRQGSR